MTAQSLLADLPASDRDAVFGANALSVYGRGAISAP